MYKERDKALQAYLDYVQKVKAETIDKCKEEHLQIEDTGVEEYGELSYHIQDISGYSLDTYLVSLKLREVLE